MARFGWETVAVLFLGMPQEREQGTRCVCVWGGGGGGGVVILGLLSSSGSGDQESKKSLLPPGVSGTRAEGWLGHPHGTALPS